MQNLDSDRFAIVGVNVDDSREKLETFMRREGITWPTLFDGGCRWFEGPIATRWRIRGLPTVYVIDHEGIIRYQQRFGDDLEAAVKTLMKRMKAEKR